jgi:S1-C subfamily serine protease
MDAPPEGVRVQRVVENSPGDLAGLDEGDLLLEVRDASGRATELRWPSEWRALELGAPPGSRLVVVYDRAGAERETTLETVRRVRSPDRQAAERFREEQRVGFVVRTATEVEARAAGLGPGAGAVVVGLSAGSPWRAAGLRFGDLVATVDDAPVAHPQVLLDAVRDAGPGHRFELGVWRAGRPLAVTAPVSRREQEARSFSVPPLVSFDSDRGSTELSVLLGLFRHRTTPAAWDWRFLWLFSASGGDADRLVEVGE